MTPSKDATDSKKCDGQFANGVDDGRDVGRDISFRGNEIRPETRISKHHPRDNPRPWDAANDAEEHACDVAKGTDDGRNVGGGVCPEGIEIRPN